MKRSLTVPLLAAAAAGVLFVGVSFFAHANDSGSIASGIVSDCAHTTDHAACYESEVPSLYPKLSVPQIFDVVRAVRTDDPNYQFCHVLGHKIGERVVAEDPSKWVDAIPLNPADGLCSNGFIHGVVGGRFRSEVLSDTEITNLLPDFKRACAPREDWNPSDLDRAICYHGMGHLFDYITNANIPKALGLCSQVAPTDFSRVCIEGVFMQIYQPLEPDDYKLIDQMQDKPSTTTVRAYCSQYANPEYQGACLRESWPYYQSGILSGTGVQSFCSGQPDAERTNDCYQSVSAIIGRMSLGQPAQAAAACNKFPLGQQLTCFSYTAQAVLEENRNESSKAIGLCNLAQVDIAQGCLSALTNHARFIFGPDASAFASFCSELPKDMQPSCK